MRSFVKWIKKNNEVIIFGILSIMLSIFKNSFFLEQISKSVEKDFVFNAYSGYVYESLVFLALGLIITKKRPAIALLVGDVLTSIVLVGNLMYMNYYRAPLTLNLLGQIGSVTEGNMGDSIFACARVEFLIPLFASLFFILLYVIYRLIVKKIFKELNYKGKRRYWKSAFTGIIILAMVVTGIGYNLSQREKKGIVTVMDANLSKIGLFQYHVYDALSCVSRLVRSNSVTEEQIAEIDKYYKEKNSEVSKFFGTAKNKNLIVIQLEAFQNYVINRKWLGQEITPVLNSLIKDNLYFNNLQYQTSLGNTSDAEFMFHTGLLPSNDSAACFTALNNTFRPFDVQMKDRGYVVNAFHGFNESFWNRKEIYKSYGADNYYGFESLNQSNRIGWGIEDNSVYEQALDISIEKMNKENKSNFYEFMISLSSHHPYDAVENSEFKLGELEDTILGNYIKSMNYVDDSIGNLIRNLKKKKLYDDTMIVVYGDHSGTTKDMLKDMLKTFDAERPEAPDDVYWARHAGVPFMIINSGVDSKKVSDSIKNQTCGQVDIMPTVASLAGIKMPYALGRDLLVEKDEHYVCFKTGNVTSDDFYLVNEQLYDKETLQVVDNDMIKNKMIEQREQNRIGQMILNYDYFSHKK